MRNRATNHLKKARIRQSWSKYNLYNLSRFREPLQLGRTVFQQKWEAKSITRGYHGEMVREGQWERMFSRRLRAVVPMNARDLAENDGTRESAGRGSGLDTNQSRPPPTPYMQMAYAPLERRLDVAIFRAMFASSARQARQFVVHGAVKVNGKKMRYPGYLLNPGDMFQVDPERVMYATGAPKDPKERRAGRLRRRARAQAAEEGESNEAEAKGAEEEAAATEQSEKKEAEAGEEDPRKVLKNLLSQAKGMLASHRDVLPAKRKQDLRGFQANVRRVLSRSHSSTVLTDSLEAQFLELKNNLQESLKKVSKPAESSASSSAEEGAASASTDSANQQESKEPKSAAESQSQQDNQPETRSALAEAFAKLTLNDTADLPSDLSDSDLEILRNALVMLHENPIDSSKPYATPWRPRDYMSAFAFIPRYLEVHPTICAAVYVRHPVARPGQAEVPTPFSENMNGSAFAWYLRRR
ncbi:hypothetical protein VTO42DRAFT_354 [Malbranchea cinnamomea]